MVRKLMLLLFVTDSYYPWILGYKIASIPDIINLGIHVFIRSLYYFLLKRNAFSGIRLLKDFICKILPKEMRIMNPFPK